MVLNNGKGGVRNEKTLETPQSFAVKLSQVSKQSWGENPLGGIPCKRAYSSSPYSEIDTVKPPRWRGGVSGLPAFRKHYPFRDQFFPLLRRAAAGCGLARSGKPSGTHGLSPADRDEEEEGGATSSPQGRRWSLGRRTGRVGVRSAGDGGWGQGGKEPGRRRRRCRHSPAGRSGWIGRHLRARSLSTTSQLFLPISKMPRSRTCSAAASGCCGDTHSAQGTAAAAGGASSSSPPSRALTRPPRFPRGMVEPQAGL